MTSAEVRPTRNWSVPITVAAAIAVLLLAGVVGLGHLWSHGGAAASDSRHWPAGISRGAMHRLAHNGYVVTTSTSRGAPADEGPAVDSAVAQLGFLNSAQVRTVTLADVSGSQKATGVATSGSTWVIEFEGVPIPALGGRSNGNPGSMVVTVDAATLRFESALSY